MSMPEDIMINGRKYIPEDSILNTNGEIKIVVADRGFVYVGYLEETDNFAILRKANNIRVWGTTKGLGELVSGPTSNTRLDKVGTVRIPNRAVISIIDVEQSKWQLL